MLLPGLKKAREVTKRTVCTSNLKQLGTGIFQYVGDHDDWACTAKITGGDYWFANSKVGAYVKHNTYVPGTAYFCPSDNRKLTTNYKDTWISQGGDPTKYITSGSPNYGYIFNAVSGFYDTCLGNSYFKLGKVSQPGNKIFLTDNLGKYAYYAVAWQKAYSPGVLDNYALFASDDMNYSYAPDATRHSHAFNAAFVDGHAQLEKTFPKLDYEKSQRLNVW